MTNPSFTLLDALEHWPSTDDDLDELPAALRRTDPLSFVYRPLGPLYPTSNGIVVDGPLGAEAKYVVVDSGEPGPVKDRSPFMATLRVGPDGEWYLASLLFECPSCFGTGIVPENLSPCETCGSSGWGVAAARGVGSASESARSLAAVTA